MVHFGLNIKACCLHVIWEKQDQIWAKLFSIPKNMHSRTPTPLLIPLENCFWPPPGKIHYWPLWKKLFRRPCLAALTVASLDNHLVLHACCNRWPFVL